MNEDFKHLFNKHTIAFVLLMITFYGLINEGRALPYTDEYIYTVSAAYLENGTRISSFHPELIKTGFMFAMTEQQKVDLRSNYLPDIRFFTNGTKSNKTQEYAAESAIVPLRVYNALALLAFCILAFDFTTDLLIVFAALFLTGSMFQAMMDGWMIGLSSWLFLITRTKKPNNIKEGIKLVLLSLTKGYGLFYGLAILSYDYIKNNRINYKLACLASIIAVFLYITGTYNAANQEFGAGITSTFNGQISVLEVRWIWPAITLLLLDKNKRTKL